MAAVLVSLTTMYGTSLVNHMKLSGKYYTDDAVQHVAPFLRPVTDLPRDYVERYWTANLPMGYKALYRSAGFFTSPRAVSRWLPYPLLFLSTLLLSVAAYRFGGLPSALALAALALSADFFLAKMAGGLTRAFAFPFFAGATAAAVWGRPLAMAAAVSGAAAFYPAVAVPSGFALAVILLVLPCQDRGRALSWSPALRVTVVAATALLAALIVLPNVLAIAEYGPLIGPAELKDFPEARHGGRLGENHRVDYDVGIFEAVRTHAALSFENRGKSWLPAAGQFADGPFRTTLLWVLVAISLPGAAWLVACKEEGRRLLVLSLAVLFSYLLSRWLSPYLFLPNRHIRFTVPLLTLLWFVASVSAIPDALGALRRSPESPGTRHPWMRSAPVLLLSILCLLLAGGRVHGKAGLFTPFQKGEALYSFLASLPEDSFIAGWPNWMAPVPYLSERAVFVSQETHLPYHVRYTLEMRRRMRLLIDAYFARSPEALLRLRDDMGVTHLVVNQDYLEGKPNLYFSPFIGWVRKARFQDPPGGFEALRQKEHAGIFQKGPHFVLDLSLIGRD